MRAKNKQPLVRLNGHKNGPKVSIDLNVMITSVVGVLIVWAVTSSLGTTRKTAETVSKIEITLPFIKDDVTKLNEVVKDTKRELKDSINEVKIEQQRVRDDIKQKPEKR